MDETKKFKDEDTDVGLRPATLAGASAVSVAPAPRFWSRGVSSAGAATAVGLEKQVMPLFSAEETKDFRDRWNAIQVGFVDEPRQVVKQADSLVAAATKRLAEMFAAERAGLEGQWDRGDNVSTEDLRLALQRYRSFFGRLLSV